MPTNSYIAKLKARLDQAIIQREHWKQLAENRNSIVVTEVCPESRSVEEYIVDADSLRASWRLIRSYREQIEALRVALLEIASANPAERGIEWAKSYASDGLKGAGSELYARWIDTFNEAETLRAENAALRAKQGERQEAACWVPRACLDKLRNGRNNSPTVLTDGPAEFNDTPLYTAPQPSQGVRALVEAAQQADDVLSAIVRNDQPIETLKREYGEE